MPQYPLPEDDDGKMLNITFRVLEWLRDSKYKIFIRWHKLQWAGIVEDINFPRYDEQYGKPLSYVYGHIPNGGRTTFSYITKEFFEPRFRKLPGSGELKDTIGSFPMSDLFVFTARNTHTANDDNDNNFTYVANGNVTERFVAYEQHMNLLQATNSDLRTDILKLKRRVSDAESRAASFHRELESSREELARLREANMRLSEQTAELERTNRLLLIENASEQAKLDKKAENAIEKGELAGSTEIQQIGWMADQMNEVNKKLGALFQRGDINSSNEVVRRLSGAVGQINNKIESLEHGISKTQQTKKSSKDDEEDED